MDVDVLLTRARSACGRSTIYRLGAGGMNPSLPMPWTGLNDHSCDCSGFVSWCLGLSRRLTGVPWYDAQHNGEWLNTDAVVRDANSPYGFFDKISEPRPGAIIVFPRADANNYGHIGIVSEVGEKSEDLRVIHCSAGNYNKLKDAIAETDARVFKRPSTIFAWCAFITDVPVLVSSVDAAQPALHIGK